MGSSWHPVAWPTKSLYHLEWHKRTPNSLCKCICFANGSGVDSLNDVVCRIKTILAIHSCAFLVGRALGDDQSKSAEGPLLQTIKMAVTDVDRLLEPALGEG